MTREEAMEFIAQSVKSDVDMAKVADAIKALEQEPTTKNDVPDIYIGKIDCSNTDCNNCVNHKYCDYESITKNDLGVDAISRQFQEIVVEYPPAKLCTYPEYRDRPYFSIKYEENGEHIIGYGTYNPEVLSEYLRDYFMPSVTPQEPFINKPCVSGGVCEHDKNKVLDKIRAEIEQDAFKDVSGSKFIFVNRINQIIDKYKAEIEPKESEV